MTTQTPSHQQHQSQVSVPAFVPQNAQTARSAGPRALVVFAVAAAAATALVMVSLKHGTNADARGPQSHIVR